MFLRMKTKDKGGNLKSKKTTTEMCQVFPCSWEFFLAAPGLAQLENALALLVGKWQVWAAAQGLNTFMLRS